jgi:NAD(P)-dependent dehydrogenase (short-subunit alcohol dehydrogenase family)
VPRAIVTGGASGIGAALVSRLEAEGYEVEALDLATGFDVTLPGDWASVQEPIDVACLNAGLATGEFDVATLDLGRYELVRSVNVDGVVLGTRRMAQLMEPDARILVTASLSGLTPMPDDPVYAMTKHAVVGWVRSCAPQLAERGVSIDALCPGFADTPLLDDLGREALERAGFPLLTPEEIAEAAWTVLSTEGTGRAFVVQPGREPIEFAFPNVPGARREDGTPTGPPPALA